MNVPILDFKPKKPSHMESLQQMSEFYAAEMQKIYNHMAQLHEIQLAMIRRMVEKKFLDPETLVMMTHEDAANDNFKLLLSELDKKVVERANAGMEVVSKRSFKHWLSDVLHGRNIAVKLKVQKKYNDSKSPEVLPTGGVAEGAETNPAGGDDAGGKKADGPDLPLP